MRTVNEIFYSIQGESTFTGKPCVFVRLTGCDLRCVWCDTPYAFHEGRKMLIEDVKKEVENYQCGLVEITGGEPLLQEDVYGLIDLLLQDDITILVETGGQLSVARLPAKVIKVLDVKCPGSREEKTTHWENFELLTKRDQVKFVIADRADYEYARDTLKRLGLASRCGATLFSPVHDHLAPQVLAGWILEDRLPVRIQLQAHKYIWGADVRGV